jgi:hypothetical protein
LATEVNQVRLLFGLFLKNVCLFVWFEHRDWRLLALLLTFVSGQGMQRGELVGVCGDAADREGARAAHQWSAAQARRYVLQSCCSPFWRDWWRLWFFLLLCNTVSLFVVRHSSRQRTRLMRRAVQVDEKRKELSKVNRG